MNIHFDELKCQSATESKLFGLCDDTPPPSRPAYIDERDGCKWIAVVVNEYRFRVMFTAIDHCIDLKNLQGKMVQRCDGVLMYDSTVIFVELKERDEKGSKWVKEAEKQLRSTIAFFEKTDNAEKYIIKKAYIANNKKPRFRESQAARMEQFLTKTGYILRIEKRIVLE